MRLLLDSVILIDHFNGIKASTEFIQKHQHKELYISVITRAEVLTGFNQQQAEQAKILLDQFITLPIISEDADKAAELRQKYHWKLPDALQAALAQNHKLKLVTRNTKDFDSNEHKFVLIPYDLKK